MEPIAVHVARLAHAEGLPLPSYATEGSSGVDLHSANWDPIELAPGARRLVPTGLCVAIPAGFELQVRPRSGLALRHGITVLNTPGTVDSDYRGELQVILVNLGEEPFTIERGLRIAQAILSRVERIAWTPVPVLSPTPRGAGGFGHTGLQAHPSDPKNH